MVSHDSSTPAIAGVFFCAHIGVRASLNSRMPTLSACALPDHVDPDHLRGRVAVVIDVLRATTTITVALENGAGAVVPVGSVDAARLVAHDRAGALLCGERGGVRPEGFDLGNSPAEYSRERVGGRDLVLTTTNGTRALHMCSGADTVLAGSVVNLGAVCEALDGLGVDAVLVCSGTDRRVSLEDCLCAGLMAQRLGGRFELDDSVRLMESAANDLVERCAGVEGAVRASFHARRLVDLGFGEDVRDCAMPDRVDCVGEFDPATGEIRLMVQPGAIGA